MKKIRLIIIVTTLLFIFKINGQETSLGTSPNDCSVAFSPDGQHVVFAYESAYNNDDAYLKVFHYDGNGNYSSTTNDEYVLPKAPYSWGFSELQRHATSITNNGNWYVYYLNGDENGTEHFSLIKNGIEILSKDSEESYFVKTSENDFVYLATSPSVDNAKVYKINSNGNIIWETSYTGDYIDEINVASDGTPYIRKMVGGDLLKIDPADGSIIQTIPAETDDVFQINENDYLEWLDYSDMKLYTETGSTEWEYRFWTESAKGKWKKFGNYTYFIAINRYYAFDEQMEDLYTKYIGYIGNNVQVLDYYVYDDMSVTYITRDSNTQEVKAQHFNIPTVAVPNLNPSATNVVEIHDEEIYNGTNWVPSNSFISTVVMNDADIPTQGTEVDQNLVIPPTDYTLIDYSPFIPTVNADGYADFLYFNGAGGNWYVRLKVYFQPLSDVSSIDEIENNKIDLGYYNKNTQTFNFNQSIDISNYQVYDMNGRKILANNKQVDKVELNNLKTGIYIIKAYDKNENEYKKKIIKY